MTGVGEAICQRCGGPNVRTWHAPSPLWNAVMRDPATGLDEFGVVCPNCFGFMAEAKGLHFIMHFGPHEDVSHLWQDRDGRRWDAGRCLWVATSRAATTRVDFWLFVARACIAFDWPKGAIAALDKAQRIVDAVNDGPYPGKARRLALPSTPAPTVMPPPPPRRDGHETPYLLGRDDKPVFPDTDE